MAENEFLRAEVARLRTNRNQWFSYAQQVAVDGHQLIQYYTCLQDEVHRLDSELIRLHYKFLTLYHGKMAPNPTEFCSTLLVKE